MGVTIKDISDRCEVSISAVSKALNHKKGIGHEKAELVRITAAEMGYYANAPEKLNRTNRSYNIGVLYDNDISHEYFSLILDAIRGAAGENDYDLTLIGGIYPRSTQGYYERVCQRQCDGVIVFNGIYNHAAIDALLSCDLPVVSIDCILGSRTAILGEHVGGMETIVKYLFNMGHTRLAFIHGDMGDVTKQRLTGFYRGCRDCGIAVPEDYVVPAHYRDAKEAERATRRLLALPERPECIIYPDDISYLGGAAELARQGLSVPGDISCFGYDGIKLAELLSPRLSTYKQDALAIGRQAAHQLIQNIENPKYYVPQVIHVAGSIQAGETVKSLVGMDALI